MRFCMGMIYLRVIGMGKAFQVKQFAISVEKFLH